jgi:hypothetical protein
VWEIIEGRLNSIMCALRTCTGQSTPATAESSRVLSHYNNAAEFGHRAVTRAWASSWAHGGGGGGAAEVASLSKSWRRIAKFTVVNAPAIRVQSHPRWGTGGLSASRRTLTLLYGQLKVSDRPARWRWRLCGCIRTRHTGHFRQ